MWGLIRPDVINALNNKIIKDIFPRYVKIINDETIAKFKIAKSIDIKFNKRSSIEEIWKKHLVGMNKFYKTLKYIDDRKVDFFNLKTVKNSLLDLKIFLTKEIMKSCELCERKCNVNRLKGEKGFCKVGNNYRISSEFIHMGEESYISPSHTIFFVGCTMSCQYCQNWSISHWYESGYSINEKKLAKIIENRKINGARNVNFVGGEPTPNLLYIIKVLKLCETNIPIIWNSNFYMSEKTMKILDGIIDMYLSDFKYGNNYCGLKLSKTKNYFDICARNHKLAAKTTEITIRHLILPNHINCCTKTVLRWINENIANKCLVNIMDQYRPYFNAKYYQDINRMIEMNEFNEAINYAKSLNINFIS